MSKYNYLEHVTNDAKKYIINHQIDVSELTSYQIVDKLWCIDDVTGNGKHGQYLTDQQIAKEYVESNTDLLKQAVSVDACDPGNLEKWKRDGDYISIDVTLRCYVLIEAVDQALVDLTHQTTD